MIETLSSPILFPSDMDSSNLTADPNFKLPEPINWIDHDYYNTMTDKSMGCMTDFDNFVPISESDIHHDSLNVVSALDHKVIIDVRYDNYTWFSILLSLAQSELQAYSFPSTPPLIIHNQDYKGHCALQINLHDALDVVEKDLKQTKDYSLYSLSEYENANAKNYPYIIDSITVDWSSREDYSDVPDLVHSIYSSSSLHSLEYRQSTSVTHLDDSFPHQQIVNTKSLLPSFLPNNAQQTSDKKKNKTSKNWAAKMKHDYVKFMRNATRKYRCWT